MQSQDLRTVFDLAYEICNGESHLRNHKRVPI